MGLFEWLGEAHDPGPIGNINTSAEPVVKSSTKRVWIVLLSILGFALFALLIFIVLDTDHIAMSALLLLTYLAISYLLTPKPDTSNVGWFGGLVNNPFRISDNYNRFLIFLYVALLPGKLIVYAFGAVYRLIKYNIR